MKILYVLNSANPGGMEKHVFDLALGMKNKGHEVFVFCPLGPINDWFLNVGIETFPFEIKWDIDPFYIRDLVVFLRDQKIDVIHSHELKAVVNSLIAAAIVGTEVRVSHTHTPLTEWRIGPIKKVLNIALDTFMINVFGSCEIALTESRKKLKLREGVRDEKLAIIPNALDTTLFDVTKNERAEYRQEIMTRFHLPKDAFIFGNVSRMTKEKGHEIAIEAFSELLEKKGAHKENSYLLLAGGGALEDSLRRLVSLLGLEKRIILTGVFPYEDLIKYYSSFDAFVFPTLAEGFGYVLVEAMYMGLPLICSDLEVLKEVGGNTVTFFKTRNSSDLASKMIKLLKNPESFEKKAQKAKEKVVSDYSLEKFIFSYEKLYKDLFEASLAERPTE
jgi:glycosyltransferase involved in cell wall biosynthesis